MISFSRLHPAVLLLFFSVTIVISLSFSNPFISVLSLVFALLYIFTMSVKSGFKTLVFSLAVIFAVSLFNFLFAHYGNDVLFTVRNTEFTLNALFFGLNQGVMLASSLIWFRALGECLDSERIISLLRFMPRLAMLFSVVLGFIPRFLKKHSDIRDARLGLNGGESGKTVREKMRTSLENFSVLISYSLESSIITADSMTARGYNPKAVRVSRFKFTKADFIILTMIIVFASVVITQRAIGNLSFVFDPDIYINRLSIPALIIFAFLEAIPFTLNLWENMRWKHFMSKV